LYDIWQEPERVYSYNPGAHTGLGSLGQAEVSTLMIFINRMYHTWDSDSS